MNKLSTTGRLSITVATSLLTGLILAGCGGGDTPAADGKGQLAGGQTAPGGSTGGSGSPGGSGGAPGGSGGSPGGQLGGGVGGAPAAVASAPPKNTTPPPGARPDPFKPWWDSTPPPPPVLSLITPFRIATTDTVDPKVEPGIEIQEVPSRRVAGILTGNGVYALLDGNGKQEIVRPGDVLDDGYRVTMINFNSVTLKKTVNNQTFTQVVPLTDAGSTPSAGGGSFGGPTAPGGGAGKGAGGPAFGGPRQTGGGKSGAF